MASGGQGWTDERVEQLMGRLLQTGVLLAAAVVVVGGVGFLARHGEEVPDYRTFRSDVPPPELRRPTGIVEQTLDGRGRAFIQLGLLLLIATPVARVVFSVYAFVRERDWFYVGLTLFVLAVLVYGLFFSKF